ncbi:MAG: pyruvate formate lyase-activating protein, partial [Methanothrix sp.]|nr:pyruvate formate lyase-activating protein [Methanothrix sp.]
YVDSIPGKIERVLVTGPRRQSFLSCGAIKGAVAASPGGDMMITGCIGLLEAWKKREELWR